MMGGNWSSGTSAGLASVRLPAADAHAPIGLRLSVPGPRRATWWDIYGDSVLMVAVLGMAAWVAINHPWAVAVIAAVIFARLLLLPWIAPAMARTQVGRAVVFAGFIRDGAKAYTDRFPSRRSPTLDQEFFAIARITEDDLEYLDAIRLIGKPPTIY